jgi:hypothetical protein
MNPLIKLKLEAVDDDKLLLAAALAEASGGRHCHLLTVPLQYCTLMQMMIPPTPTRRNPILTSTNQKRT